MEKFFIWYFMGLIGVLPLYILTHLRFVNKQAYFDSLIPTPKNIFICLVGALGGAITFAVGFALTVGFAILYVWAALLHVKWWNKPIGSD